MKILRLPRFAIVAFLSLSCVQSSSDNLLAEPPVGLPALTEPKDNPSTEAKIELGRMLYFDKRLSSDNTVSCASCHDPKHGWSNNDATAVGVGGQRGGRSAPTIINSAYQKFQFWDGRAGSLEEQALGPIANPIEMNLPIEEAVKKLSAIEGYQKRFQEVFGSGVTADNLAKAIAAFERTVISGGAPYDLFKGGDKNALTPEAQTGMKLFFGKANCSACHNGPHFTDLGFHNLGVGAAAKEPDQGRRKISGLEGDQGSFRTPTLREIARTAPYMHDGSLKTLEEVVDYYNQGGTKNDYLDEEIYQLKLTDAEKKALVTFLKEGLTSTKYPDVAVPELP
ncbi:MAG: c-type cytochrome [Pirellulaceae bacterium]|nr:c-type cytochrome [Pirellulaceae bacterium]